MAASRLLGSYQGSLLGSRAYPAYDEGSSAPLALPPDAPDGPLGVIRPYYPEHWPLVAAGITEPDYMWVCDEASGDLLDLCNLPRAALTARTNVAYLASISGWARPFARITAEATGSGFRNNIGELWNIGSQSVLVLFYAAVNQSGGNRCLWLGGGGNGLQVEIVPAGQATSFVNGTRTIGSFVYEAASPTVYPFAYHWDRRGAGEAKLFTNKESIVSAWVNLSDNAKGFGSPSLASPQAYHGLCAVWVGGNAESMMDRGAAGLGGKTLVADLGWPMAY